MQIHSPPTVSVVMTAYNSARYIREAIESILKQTYADFEFIIVDDASSDQTPHIIESYKDPRIVFIRNPRNLGQTKSLNIGIKISLGKYIARMDADDVSMPDRFALQVDYLEKNPDVALVGSWTQYIDQNGRAFRLFKTPCEPLDLKCYLIASGEMSYWCINHPTVIIRKNAFDEVGLYNEEKGEIQGYPQDYELWARFLPKYNFANIPKVLLKYRVLRQSDSRKFAYNQLDYRYEITERKIRGFLPDMSEEEIKVLAYMLEFRPQLKKQEGQRALVLFDRFFDAVLGANANLPRAQKIRQQLKFYYLPQLFRTNKMLALNYFREFVLRSPKGLFDQKFYRKIIKSFMVNRQWALHKKSANT